MKKGQILFDDWSEVKDCNKCEPYWNNQCDGVKVGSKKSCTAFKATRSVDIPLEIETLKKRITLFRLSVLCIAIAEAIHFGVHILERL